MRFNSIKIAAHTADLMTCFALYLYFGMNFFVAVILSIGVGICIAWIIHKSFANEHQSAQSLL
jgi:hypothetical protein